MKRSGQLSRAGALVMNPTGLESSFYGPATRKGVKFGPFPLLVRQFSDVKNFPSGTVVQQHSCSCPQRTNLGHQQYLGGTRAYWGPISVLCGRNGSPEPKMKPGRSPAWARAAETWATIVHVTYSRRLETAREGDWIPRLVAHD